MKANDRGRLIVRLFREESATFLFLYTRLVFVAFRDTNLLRDKAL